LSPLQGNLEDFDITDILELINIGKKDGALEIKSNEHNGIIYFENGIVVDVSANEYKGDDAIHYILRWETGRFYFDPHKRTTIKTVNIPIQKLMLDAARQLDEWKKIEETISSVNVILKLNENPKTEENELTINDEEWRVLSLVDGDSSLKEIARKINKSEIKTGKIIYDLIMSGMIVINGEKTGIDDESEVNTPVDEADTTEDNENSEQNNNSKYIKTKKKKKKGGLFRFK